MVRGVEKGKGRPFCLPYCQCEKGLIDIINIFKCVSQECFSGPPLIFKICPPECHSVFQPVPPPPTASPAFPSATWLTPQTGKGGGNFPASSCWKCRNASWLNAAESLKPAIKLVPSSWNTESHREALKRFQGHTLQIN